MCGFPTTPPKGYAERELKCLEVAGHDFTSGGPFPGSPCRSIGTATAEHPHTPAGRQQVLLWRSEAWYAERDRRAAPQEREAANQTLTG